MIDLGTCQPFASGYNRHCFRHPGDPLLCLKVLRPENIEARYQRQPLAKKLLGRRRIDDNAQELKAHRQRAIRRLLSRGEAEVVWQHLPRFHGTELTSLGSANVSELLLDDQGQPAQTLEHYLRHQGFDQPMRDAVGRFCDWLQATGILTRNLLPHNLVVTARSGQPELFLVDGLGAPTIPQTLARVPGWNRHYIARKLARFELRLAWEQSDQVVSWERFQRLK